MQRPVDPRTRRWSRAALASVGMALVVVLVGATSLTWRAQNARVPLLSQTVALDADGGLTLVAPGPPAALMTGSRVLSPADPAGRAGATALAQDQRRWLAAGSVPGADGPFAPMVRDALLDLRTLTAPSGAVVAAGSSNWRYVWPRDASFVAVAYARTGHLADADAVLGFLAGVQAAEGSFQARYRPDGSGPPDDRGIQEDGPGWVLWAAGQVHGSPGGDRTLPASVLTMVDRASSRVLRLTADGTRLPEPSSDYWEQPERTVTLGTVAPMLAGLEAVVPLYRSIGQPARAQRIEAAADRLRRRVESGFGVDGYPRHLGGKDVDAALALTVPPFQPSPLAGVGAVWPRAITAMRRPAGGLAPGQGWKNDGISWTPETALFALAAAANGRPVEARTWLTWLDEHRTAAGSLPEKVLSNGAPAAVAPLAWTAALVVLTVATLDEESAGSSG